MSQTTDAQDEEFSIIVPEVDSAPQKRRRAPEESVDAVLYEIEDSEGNIVKYRVRFEDGAVYDVSCI